MYAYLKPFCIKWNVAYHDETTFNNVHPDSTQSPPKGIDLFTITDKDNIKQIQKHAYELSSTVDVQNILFYETASDLWRVIKWWSFQDEYLCYQ